MYLMLSMCYLMPKKPYESNFIAIFFQIQEKKIREAVLFAKGYAAPSQHYLTWN